MLGALADLGITVETNRRVLIVDDEPENLDVLEALLESEFEIVRASTGLQALAVLEKHGPVDLVISDQRMPGMTGVELLGRLSILYPNTIRIVLTAYADVEPIAEAVNRGSVYRFLLKPWEPGPLRQTVRDGLALQTQRTLLTRLMDGLAEKRAALSRAITERERAHHQLVAADRITSLGRITSGITHDINNQLSAMVFLVEALRAPGQTKALREAAEAAVGSLEALLVLIQDVNAFARSRTIEIQPQAVALGELLRDTVKLLVLEPGLGDAEGRVRVELGASAAWLDPARVRQALLALLRNAFLASPGGSEVTLLARASRPDSDASGSGESGLAIEVLDRGHGLTAEAAARAFEPFFSGFEPKGLGLGLGIADLVARAHGGSLSLESRSTGGTRAVLSFPPGPLSAGAS